MDQQENNVNVPVKEDEKLSEQPVVAEVDGTEFIEVVDDYDLVTRPFPENENPDPRFIPHPATALTTIELLKITEALDEAGQAEQARLLQGSNVEEDFALGHRAKNFKNKIVHNDHEIRPKFIKVKPTRAGAITAMAALQMAYRYADATHSTVPLPYTGIWLTLRAPSELERFSYQQKIMAVERGENLMGSVMSQTHIRIMRKIHTIDFVIDNIVGSNLEATPDEWRDILIMQDLDILTTFLAGNIFTRGYDYHFRCFNTECNHVEARKVLPNRLVQYDFDDILTPYQMNMLADSKRKVTMEEYWKYQSEFLHTKHAISETKFGDEETNDVVQVVFRNPSMSDFITSGRVWMQEVETEMMQTVLDTATTAEKKKYLRERVAREPMSEKIFRVARINHGERDDDGNFMNDPIESPEAISAFFRGLGSTNRAVINASLDLDRYLMNTLLYSVGMPNHVCPKCKQRQQAAEGKFRDRIAMNPEVLFIYALFQSLSKRGL